MRGLLLKSLHEVWLLTLLLGVALMGVLALLTFVLPQIQDGLGGIFEQLPFVKSLFTAMLGSELGDEITARSMQAFIWVHPTVLALIWAHEIAVCTRIPAGEIDRGTIDVLLGFPISRRQLYTNETIIWLVSGLLILLMGLLGHRLAAPSMPASMRPELGRVALVMANLYGVYVAVGGIAFLVSALSDRRGRAVALIFAILLLSFLLNFLAQLWQPAKQIAFLGLMNYYQPAQILLRGELPYADVVVLLAVGGVAWWLGGRILVRRSIATL